MTSSYASAGGVNGVLPTARRFDPEFTDNVVNAVGPKANPRMRKVMASLVRHLHDLCRENEVTVDEYMAGIELVSIAISCCIISLLMHVLQINTAGKMSDDKRNETQLLLAILGVESLVDEITYKLADDAADAPTATAILGPFWRKDAPIRQMGDTIVSGFEDSPDHALLQGRVLDFTTGKPIANAELDVWETAPNGLYEVQDPQQPDMNLRGRFTTGSDGTYHFYCLRPTKYPIPYDGPAGEVLQLLDRHPWRPAHIHFIVTAAGYKPLVTQIFDRKSEFVGNDVAFAVKDSLVVDFIPRDGDEKAQFELEYDFKLARYEDVRANGVEGATEPEG